MTNRMYSRLPGSVPFIGRILQRKIAHLLADQAKAGDIHAVQRLIGMLSGNSDGDLNNIIQDALSSLTHPTTIDALCQRILREEYPVLEEIARRQGYMPSDTGSQALFLVCIDRRKDGNLPKGEFEYALLRKAFNQAPDAVKSRVREKIRENGLNYLLYSDLLVGSMDSVKPDLRGQDWDLIIKELLDEGRNEDLWSLLFCVPPLHSFRISRELQKKGWNPSSPLDQALWNEILSHLNKHSTFRPPVKLIWHESPHGDFTCFSIMPGKNLLTSGDRKGLISHWTLPEGNFLKGHWMHADIVDHLTFSHDGTLLASGDRSGTVHLAQTTDMTILGTWFDPTGVLFLQFTPKGRQLVMVNAKGIVTVYDIQNYTIAVRFDTSQRNIVWLEVAEGSDGSVYLITGDETTICLFSLSGGELISTRNHRSKRSTSFTINSDKSILFVGFSDSTIRLYQIPDLNPIHTLKGHEMEVTALTEAAEGSLLASGSADGMICLWDLPAGSLRATIRTHAGAIYLLKNLPHSSKLMSGSDDGTVRLWHLPDGSPSGTFQDPAHHIRSFLVTSDESLLITQGTSQETRLWSLVDTRPYGTLKNLPETIFAMATQSEEDILVSSGGDRTLYVRTLGNGNLVKTIAMYTGKIASLAFLPDGKTLACGGDDRMIHLWDLRKGERTKTMQASKGTISAIAINPDGTLIAGGGWDQIVRLWNPTDGSLLAEMKGHSSVIRALCFSPDGTILASTGNDSSIFLWNPHTRESICQLRGHRGVVSCLAFTQDGQFLLSGGWDKKICIWNPKTGVLCRILDGYAEKITQLTISKDGSIAITGCQDGTIRFWSLYDGMLVLTLWGHTGAVTALASDGDRIVSGGEDGSIKSWSLPWVKPLALATPEDLLSVQQLLAENVHNTEALRSRELLEALIQVKVSCDIETETINRPQGEYDIELV
jgi:WD40 repeat protein